MNKRSLILGILALPFAATQTIAATAVSYVRNFTVPKQVNKVTVKSTSPDGRVVMDYTFDVVPGQKFIITGRK